MEGSNGREERGKKGKIGREEGMKVEEEIKD